jgi:hypothetical protein
MDKGLNEWQEYFTALNVYLMNLLTKKTPKTTDMWSWSLLCVSNRICYAIVTADDGSGSAGSDESIQRVREVHRPPAANQGTAVSHLKGDEEAAVILFSRIHFPFPQPA